MLPAMAVDEETTGSVTLHPYPGDSPPDPLPELAPDEESGSSRKPKAEGEPHTPAIIISYLFLIIWADAVGYRQRKPPPEKGGGNLQRGETADREKRRMPPKRRL